MQIIKGKIEKKKIKNKERKNPAPTISDDEMKQNLRVKTALRLSAYVLLFWKNN
jgi:hypothetical protein